MSWRYLWRVTALHRSETKGDAGDLPPPLPQEFTDERSKVLGDGAGRMYHRVFRVRIERSAMTPGELFDTLSVNVNKGSATSVAVFHKTRGTKGEACPGDEFLVKMPGPWDGPIRLVRRDATSLRFGTLHGHLEAGQIEFRAREDEDGLLVFEVEAWCRAGDRWADLLYGRLRVAKEIQFNMWVHFCLRVVTLTGGRTRGGVTIETRGIPESACREAVGR